MNTAPATHGTATGEVIDAEYTEETTALAVAEEKSALAEMAAHGMIVPIASPQNLRALYALRQKMYAAILDENDYLWVVHYQDTAKGRTFGRQYIAPNRKAAEERAEALNGSVSGNPIKSGIQKLAEALGITTRAIVREERTVRGETGYYVEYEARHEKTGKIETGVAFCDPSERNGKMSTHDMIATADTRAYNRAVLRLSAFGAVSAEEIVSGNVNDAAGFIPEHGVNKVPQELPATTDSVVVSAAEAWALNIHNRDVSSQFLPDAQQNVLSARITRASARRGDMKAAKALGATGLRWEGEAQDSRDHQVFRIDDAPDIAASTSTREVVDPVAEGMAKDASPGPTSNGKGTGWDLSGGDDDKGLPEDLPDKHAPIESRNPQPSLGIPAPHPDAETITTGQAKKVSVLMVNVLGSKEAAKAWLSLEARVERSTKIRSNQYEKITDALNKIQKDKG